MVGSNLDDDIDCLSLFVDPADYPRGVLATSLVFARTLVGIATDSTLASVNAMLVLKWKKFSG